MTVYSGGPSEESARLTGEASDALVAVLLASGPAKVVFGAIVVEFDEGDRPDVVIFESGAARELVTEAGPDKARAIVAAAAEQREIEKAQALSGVKYRPGLPPGLSSEETDGPWSPYLVAGGAGEWMAWRQDTNVFDFANAEELSFEVCLERCYFLNQLELSRGEREAIAHREMAAAGEKMVPEAEAGEKMTPETEA